MFIYFDKKTGLEKRRGSYIRKDISEPIEGETDNDVYKLLDRDIDYNYDYQIKRKLNIDISTDIYEGHEHIKIAYQNYEVVEKSDIKKDEIFCVKFGQWIDEQYSPIKRTKHLTELINNPTTEREAYIKSFQEWELEQRNLFVEKRTNKDYTLNFTPKP